MNQNLDILIVKLDGFIRKFYKNQIIKGFILTTTLFLAFFLFAAITEYFGHFSSGFRTVLFYGVSAISFAIFIKLILIPTLQFFKIGKITSYKQASNILAKHFGELQDKLTNTLELADIKNIPGFSQELIIASINKRISALKPIPFNKAVNLKENLKYARYLAFVGFIILVILIFWPSVITEGTERVVKYDSHFEPKAPFDFILLNDTLSVQKGNDFQVKLEMRGNFVPEIVYIVFGNSNFQMTKISKSKFSYTFKNINNNVEFSFSADQYRSQQYVIKVLPAPTILDFSIAVDVPAYTRDTNKLYENIGDITVPCGSKIKWNFNTKDIDSLTIVFNDSIKLRASKGVEGFSVSKLFLIGSNYKIAVSNKHFKKSDLVKYNINVIPDLGPGIKVNTIKDSAKFASFYFNGIINDDYGFQKLTFNYKITGKDAPDNSDTIVSILLPLNAGLSSQEFYYAFDFSSIKVPDNKKIEYYFEVWDNDAVNGSKSAQSTVYDVIIPTKDDLQKFEDESSKNLEAKMDESLKLAKELKRDINNLQENLINKNLSSWDKTKIMEQISSKQNRLEDLTQQISKEFEKKNEMLNSFSEQQKEILEKQKQMQELLENVFTDEMKKMLEELNKLMQDVDKKKVNELAKDMKLNYEDLSKQLDRNMELLKKYEIEKKIDNTIERLNELAEKQNELSEKTAEKGADENKEALSEEQKKQAEEFEKISQEYEKVLDENKELKNPMDLDKFEKEKEDISNDFKEGSKEMKENKMKKASKKQKENSSKIKNMSENMKNMMQKQQAQQQEEDLDALRKILENIVTFSFNQENLMEALKEMQAKNPKFIEAVSTQKNLSDNFKVIKDSLTALAKRTPQLKSIVNKEIGILDKSMEKTLESMGDRNIHQSRTSQQFVMTSANNLALLLSEALKQMENNMEGMSGGQCSKPKKGGKKGKKPNMKGMKEQQESLKQQLQQMLDQMKKGGKDGKGNFDPNATNKQLSKMLAQQEIFSQMMDELMSNSKLSPQAQKALNDIKGLMEKNQTDLINKNITPEMMKRQNLIETRLLDAENAEFQREIDNKRESKEAKDEKYSNPEEIFKYKGINSKFNEMINFTDIKLYKYYKNKYKEYLIKLNDN
ncbi:MAG: hypothetical protein A2275_17790 [Bacteroidetes bacterium RIFOXYA12_FULL_35_11]|nr:MAG: hypothetical protein A2275_17790 [Bacteroidetes bacterium RIFOXYA12_FULL_35_11]